MSNCFYLLQARCALDRGKSCAFTSDSGKGDDLFGWHGTSVGGVLLVDAHDERLVASVPTEKACFPCVVL